MLPRGVLIGIALQIASFLTGYLSLRYLYAMGWFGCLVLSLPLFLASLFYILRAPAPLWLRLLLSFWLLAFPLYNAAILGWEYWQIRPEVVLLPSGFHGNGQIHFSEPNGAPEEVENGKLVLRVDPSGQLRTQARQRRFTNSWANNWYDERREYHAIDPSGRRVKLEMVEAATPMDRVVLIPGGIGYDTDRIVWLKFYYGAHADYIKYLESR